MLTLTALREQTTMTLGAMAIGFYVLATLFAIVMCYREQRRVGQTQLIFNLMSLAACIAWPLIVALCLVNFWGAAEVDSA